MSVIWNPGQYNRFADDRGRPFFDLVGRVLAVDPRRVVDLGCGTGSLTATLSLRWPFARILGVDSSAEMINGAAAAERLHFELHDIETWQPPSDVDVILSNAALQWVPTHREMLRRWSDALPSGGWLAWQVPGNFSAPSHVLMRELAESPRWHSRLAGVLRHNQTVDDALGYARLLLESGLVADTWETTYLHVLQGPDPVLEWVRGTGLRPVLTVLEPPERVEFERDYSALLDEAYPAGVGGTVFPFRRIFAVGHKP